MNKVTEMKQMTEIMTEKHKQTIMTQNNKLKHLRKTTNSDNKLKLENMLYVNR